MTVRIGVISDTHGLVRPEALNALAGSDAIIHAGDIGNAAVLAALEAIAPVTAVRGNNDTAPWARAIPETTVVRFEDVSILVLHDVHALSSDDAQPYGVIIAGHSHRPSVQRRGDVVFLNPGSAGPRRFTLPVAIARLRIDGNHVEARIEELAIEPAARSSRNR